MDINTFYTGRPEEVPQTHGSTLEIQLLQPGLSKPPTLRGEGTLLWGRGRAGQGG